MGKIVEFEQASIEMKLNKHIHFSADMNELEKERALQFYNDARNNDDINQQLKLMGWSWKTGAMFENVLRDDTDSKKFKTVLWIQENRKHLHFRKEVYLLKAEKMKEEKQMEEK